MSLEIFEDPVWQMSLGERAAVEGILAQLRPKLAVEIGSMEGACLARIAAYSQEAHSFDLNPPSLPKADNVTLHTGDSHELLPAFLGELAQQDRNVDFVMVDGDHTPEGVRRDIEDLLDSAAVARTVILIHDTANERVRRGVDAVRFAAWPKVAHVELDWIPGQLFAEPELRNELWYGIGLVIVDVARPAYLSRPVYEQRFHPAGALLAQIRDLVLERERVPPGAQPLRHEVTTLRRRVGELEVQLSAARTGEARLEAEVLKLRPGFEGAQRALEDIKGSASWRMTEPLRGAKRRVARHRSQG
ncbi:MAG: class I SAM-dependent methyltransferase [Solirubrobacteraceae bacterium]